MNGWFAVKDRRPVPDGVTVLSFFTPTGGPVHGGCYATATYWEGRWTNPDDSDDEYAEPTHWMFLPEAPAEGASK